MEYILPPLVFPDSDKTRLISPLVTGIPRDSLLPVKCRLPSCNH